MLSPPPRNFHSAEDVVWAELRTEGPFPFQPKGRTAAQKNGIRYERKVHSALLSQYSPAEGCALYAPAMWIAYLGRNDQRIRWAQPDGLLIDLAKGLIIVLEVKIKHTVDAWWTLRKLYEPLIRKIFGSAWRYAVCEVVRWYDPAVRWPEQLVFLPEPAALHANAFGLHILSDARAAESWRRAG